MADTSLISPAPLSRHRRWPEPKGASTCRVRKHRARKREAREAAALAADQTRRAARRARLEARRAELGLPAPGTAASRQKTYRHRLKARARICDPREELA
jgi:hypothetical protein